MKKLKFFINKKSLMKLIKSYLLLLRNEEISIDKAFLLGN